MNTPQDRVKHYRLRAKEIRTATEEMDSPESRATYLRMATPIGNGGWYRGQAQSAARSRGVVLALQRGERSNGVQPACSLLTYYKPTGQVSALSACALYPANALLSLPDLDYCGGLRSRSRPTKPKPARLPARIRRCAAAR